MSHLKREKTLVFVGASDNGKTTFLNSLNKNIDIKATTEHQRYFFKKNNTLFNVFDTIGNCCNAKDNIDANIDMLHLIEEAGTINHVFLIFRESYDFRRKFLFHFVKFFNLLFEENVRMNPLRSATGFYGGDDVVAHIQDIFSVIITRDQNIEYDDIDKTELSQYIKNETGIDIPIQCIYYEDVIRKNIFTKTYDKGISFKFYHGGYNTKIKYVNKANKLTKIFDSETDITKKKLIRCQMLLEQTKYAAKINDAMYRYLLSLEYK